jgi:aromatic ring-opening dioxygenase catalytic subunit (LigB family)
MASICGYMASSHAFAFMQPDEWDAFRVRIAGRFAERYGVEASVQPGVATETPEGNRERFKAVAAGFDLLRSRIRELRPDALVVIGDDQNENFTVENLPQLAIYTGGEMTARDRMSGVDFRMAANQPLAAWLHESLVETGFDLASAASFNDGLLSHAHAPALRVVDPEHAVPAVLLFVNAIHVPGPAPSRCYALGAALRQAIEAWPEDARVMLYASGGLSHFTAGFPWRWYWQHDGAYGFGGIAEEFDRGVVDLMRRGRGSELAKLTSKDLLHNGDVELRQWIVLHGAIGDREPELLVYEPFYRATIGMGVAYWPGD